MDLEAELVRSENWSELKRFYSTRAGHQWELAWVYLTKVRDQNRAMEAFQKTLQDPRYSEACSIMLWRLGKRPSLSKSSMPQSLKYYEAFNSGNFNTLQSYLATSPQYADAIVGACVETLSKEATLEFKALSISTTSAFLLGLHSEKYLKNISLAEFFYKKFLEDPWISRILEESKRLLFDTELSKRLRSAYSQKDGITIRRILKSISFRLEKLEKQALSPLWVDAFMDAIEFESQHLTEDLFGYSFWKTHDWSPRALERIRSRLFLDEDVPKPPFVTAWKKFFESEDLVSPPVELDPDSLALAQIKVEIEPQSLSDALLRFPTEERFLFLWSLRQRELQGSATTTEGRRWPENQTESEVVRKNLERAFDRSANKVLWFERLRQVGCSQSFYEYALDRADIPLGWVLADLKNSVIRATPEIRRVLKARLSVVGTSTEDLAVALSYLSPAETQEVLLARFVLSPLPEALLTDDYLDLLWEARGRVSVETAARWQKEVVAFIQKNRPKKDLRHWRWIELQWETDPSLLETFAPQMNEGPDFPWESYLEKLEQNEKTGLLLMCLHRIPEPRMRESWIERSLQISGADHRILSAIGTLSEDYVRHSLLARWSELKGDITKAVEHRQEELLHTPILNEQIKISRKILDLLQAADSMSSISKVRAVLDLGKFLESNGSLDAALCFEISILLEKEREFLQAWRYTVQQWLRSNAALREELLPRLIDLGSRARSVEETQRFLVDQLFQQTSPNRLAFEMIETLLNERSFLKIRHLRPEFIQKASELYPLHPALLRARSEVDYRAVLLWQSFFGEPLKAQASIPAFASKRIYELWRLTDSISNADSYSVFAKYLDYLPADLSKKATHDFKDKADRIMQRMAKQFGFRKAPKFELVSTLSVPFKIHFEPVTVVVSKDFFDMLDEESWAALSVGVLQILDDREKGLFEDKRLMERFFQAMILSGAPLNKVIRFIVWLGIHEGLVAPSILQADPQALVERLPFLNSFIIFYLSRDFEEKMKVCAIIPS